MADFEDDGSLRAMVQLLKHIFDEALLAGFSQTEAMALTSQTLQSFLAGAAQQTAQPREN